MSADPFQSPAQGASPYPVSTQGIKDVLFTFNGRIPRRTYWLYALGSLFAIGILIGIVFAVLGPKIDPATGAMTGGTLGMLIAGILYLPLLWISFALQAKRWHDRGKSGWMCIISVLGPLAIWAFIECGCLRGTVGPNQYGPDPT